MFGCSEPPKTDFLATHLIMVSAEKAVLPLISLKHELNNNQDQEQVLFHDILSSWLM